MKVVLIIPFVYARPTLDLLDISSETMAEPGMEAADLRRERLSHRGSSAFSGLLSSSSISVDGSPGRLLVGKLGVAAACVSVELTALDELAAAERRTLDELSPRFEELAAACRTSSHAPPAEVPHALWIHRLILEPDPNEQIVPLSYGIECTLSRGARCTVADGFSGATDVEDDHVEAIEDGLFAASQAWVVYDWLVHDAFGLLENLDLGRSGTPDEATAARLTDDAARVAFNARKLTGFMRRQQQGVIDGRGAVYRTAIETWGLTAELASLIDRADGYVEFVQLHAAEMRSRVDRRRNMLLFGLSFTAIAQVITGAYELLTGTTSAVGPGARPFIFGVTVVATVVGVLVGVGYAVFDLRRERR